MDRIKVIVHGALGKVGRELVSAVSQGPDTQLVGAVDAKASSDSLPLPDGSGSVPLSADLAKILEQCPADVMIDFTIAAATMPAARLASAKGVSLVIGTTGLSAGERAELEKLAQENKTGVIMAPNFALGAVLMMHLAGIAARYMDYAEIIELHHHLKADAPSGTAASTARSMAKARGKPFLRSEDGGNKYESRGQDIEGVSVHSVRLPGLMAHQEVILGTAGQTLSIRHDTINRECYMPGVLLAVKEAAKRRGFIYGLDALLDL